MNDSSPTHPSTPAGTERLVRELQLPSAYSHSVDEVGFLQTHISLLFFAGTRVYKVKKPLELGFLDFSTLELRERVCRDEVRLNRRLAGEIYLGVVNIVEGPDGLLSVGGEGEVLEWAVEMVRLPERGMLAGMLDRSEIDNEPIHALARLLAQFHAEAPTGAGVDEHGSPEAIAFNVEENFEQLEPYVIRGAKDARPQVGVLSGRQLEFLTRSGRRALAAHREFLEERVRLGRIREGHGDLHAGNVCFTESGPVAYDCIEFNSRFRCGDVGCDLAFLTMDLDHRGYPGFARYLEKRYAMAAEDAGLAQLSVFYKQYRAIVRAKVTAMAASDPSVGGEEREGLRRRAMTYLQLAVGYDLPPTLILMCGLPASGKSWMAQRLARALRASVLHSDVRRKVLGGIAQTTRVQDGYGVGLYSPELKQKTYESLLEGALELLRSGHTVIADATFSSRSQRAQFIEAARREDLPVLVVHVQASDEVSRQRLEQRASDPRAISDANLEVYLAARETFEPPTELEGSPLAELSSGVGADEDQLSSALDRMLDHSAAEADLE